MLYVVILIVMTMMGAVASYNFKLVSGSNSLLSAIKNKYLYIGGFIYVAAAGLNIYLLKFLDYSIVLPLTSLTYIWTMFISYKMLNEKITKRKLVGTALIVIGAVFLGLA